LVPTVDYGSVEFAGDRTTAPYFKFGPAGDGAHPGLLYGRRYSLWHVLDDEPDGPSTREMTSNWGLFKMSRTKYFQVGANFVPQFFCNAPSCHSIITDD
jgi:hypothetical protein